ncbi:MAG: T9SS type A sorting domain-containing protein, partial [Saprospiraceae bacterium]
HTHTLAIAMLLFLQSVVGNAQAGAFSVLSIQNLPSGHIECVISWDGNTIATARGLNIGVTASGGAVCVDPALSVIDPYFTDPANEFSVNFSNTGVTILKNPNGSNTFSLATDYSPLVTLLFRAEPGTTAAVSASGIVIEMGFSGIPISPASASQVIPNGFTLGGFISKVLGADCSTGGGSIPGITVSVSPSPTPCFPSTTYPASQLFAATPYTFFDAPGQYAYIITPSKTGAGSPEPRPECCGVNYQDILLTRDLILGRESPTLAKQLAADFNGNGFATTFDVANMWKCLNGLPLDVPLGWLPWRFAPLSEIGGPNDPPVGDMNLIPSSITTPLLNGNQTFHHFFGVKRGDVNGTCVDCGTSLIDETSEGRGQYESNHSFFMSDRSLQVGQELVIPILTQALSDATLWGMQLDFDAEHFDLLSIESRMLSNEDMVMSNILSDTKTHSAHFSWMSMKLEGEDLKERAVIAYAHIRAKKDVPSLKGLIQQPNNPDYRIIFNDQEDSPSFIKLEIETEKANLLFAAKLASQNPLSTFAQIEVTLPQADEATLAIFDNTGRVLQQQRYTLSAGTNSLVLDNIPQASGIYTASIQTRFGIQNLRFVKI